MTDLLIRNLSTELRRKLKDSANRHRKSLSDEAKRLLDKSLAEGMPSRPLGTALVEHFRAVNANLDIPREGMPDVPPDFE